jgi:acetyltransferase-like isoleucine patch superfamily enzyme
MKAFLRSLPPVRWWRTLVGLARGRRLHPSALLLGGNDRIILGRGCSIGARTRLLPLGKGRVVIGDGVWLSSDVEVETDAEVIIGAGTTIQRRCTINGATRIGRGCIFAPSVFVSSGTHPFREWPHLPIRAQEARIAAEGRSMDRAVWIQDDCWLGTHVVVSPGVTIGKGSVVGANSVVTRDVPPYSVVAGVPARAIAVRLDWAPPSDLNFADARALVYSLDGDAGPPGREAGPKVAPGTMARVALGVPGGDGVLHLAIATDRPGVRLRIDGPGGTVEVGDAPVALHGINAPVVELAVSAAGNAEVHLRRVWLFRDGRG